MTLKKIILLLTLATLPASTFATTWDEPWQDQIMREADYFVFAKVISSGETEGVTIEILKSLGGQDLQGQIKITSFYLLNLCSRSGGHGPEFHFKNNREYYFFIKKNEKGQYCIPTPTSGFASLNDGNVTATYRHSYHQALVPADIYEKTMTPIFNNYHNQPYDKQFITGYVNNYLSLKPAGFDETQINTFFAQHVALESAYHLRLTDLYPKIIPFLKDTSNFHSQISAARALISYNTPECKQELLNIINDTTIGDFVQVMCVWTLAEFKPTELKEEFVKLKETASTEGNGFGGNIMDPRVCTNLPNVKEAIEELIKTL